MTARARNTDPATSHEAAARVNRTTLGAQAEACLSSVLFRPGCTAAEIAAWMGINRHIPSRRLPELREVRLLDSHSPRTCRITGTRCLTWWPAKPGEYHQESLF